jgi:hypothetical protein
LKSPDNFRIPAFRHRVLAPLPVNVTMTVSSARRSAPSGGDQAIMTTRSIRIAVLHFSHETVTFLKNDTTLDDFIYPGSPARGEALLKFDPKNYMGGFVKMAREFDGVELVGIESPLWPKTGIGSGWVTQQAYETLVG